MKLSDLVKNISIISSKVDFNIDISGINYDSRKVKEGNIFVAIKGLNVDGHRYISKAVELGASVIVCQDIPKEDVSYIQVEDSRYALAILSRDFYGDPASKMKIIGFTGTSGKTSSTHILKHVLEESLKVKVGLIGTNGNMIGDTEIHTEFTTPESLELHKLFKRMYDEGCSYVIMEVSSHSLTMHRVAGINFEVAVYTNLSQDHLDLHGTMDEYALAKKQIFSQCSHACINADDDHASIMLEGIRAPYLRYAIDNKAADVCAEDVSLSAKGVHFRVSYGEDSVSASLGIVGRFSVYNALSVLSACLSLGINLSEGAAALSSAKGVKGRMETVRTDGDYSIIIDYSHKPDPLEKVLRTLRPITEGKLIALFGCGGDRDKLKRPIMGRIAADNADLVIVTDDNPRTEDSLEIISQIVEGVKEGSAEYIVVPNRIEAICTAIDKAGRGDVILLAGKGHEDYQIIGHEKHHMDEREIVADYLEKRAQAI